MEGKTMTYARTTTVDAAPAGDVVKQAVLDVDTDLTGIYANLNTHETATTGIHGVGSGTLVSTTGTQTLTAKTISGATITGAIECSGATLSTPTITGATINGTLVGNVTGNVTGDVTGNCSGTAATVTGAAQAAITSLGVLTALTTGTLKVTTGAAAGSVLLSDADGDLSYLALGTANQKLFTNNGATTAEWAKGFNGGYFTRAMDAPVGDVSYTGVGFKPSCVIFLSRVAGGLSIGFDTGTYHGCAAVYGTTPAFVNSDSRSIFAIQEAGVKTQTAFIKSFDSDGFTLTWRTQGSPDSADANCQYIAFR
jgi:hypothetical protein